MCTTKAIIFAVLFSSIVVGTSCNAEDTGFQKPTPEEWTAMTSEERAAFLEERLDEAADELRAASSEEAWNAGNENVARSLSLLRAELWVTERPRYVAREAELEALAEQTRP